jgi:hypothetical protein
MSDPSASEDAIQNEFRNNTNLANYGFNKSGIKHYISSEKPESS